MQGETIDTIDKAALEDCCQLVKANSIEGCKLNKVDIVYTPVGNLRQTNDMDVGQVGFHVDKHVRMMFSVLSWFRRTMVVSR